MNVRSISPEVRRPIGVAALFALVASVLTVVAQGMSMTPASAAAPLKCDGTTVYVQNEAGDVREFNSATMTLGSSNVVTEQRANGLGVSEEGRYIYTTSNSSSGATSLRIHDRVNNTTTSASTPATPAWYYGIRGAVNPANGIYYFASSHNSSNTLKIGAYNASNGTAYQVATIATGQGAGSIPNNGSTPGNGDLAFTPTGDMIITNDTKVYFVNGTVPTTPGTTTLTVTERASVSGTSNGIAFGANGNLFVSTSGTITEINPLTGQNLRSVNLTGFAPTDMASCRAYPSTLTLQKNLPGGRTNTGDQFRLSVGDGHAGYQGESVNTAGSATGIQPQKVGPFFSSTGATYSLSESATGSTSFGNYDTSIACYDTASNNAPVPVTGSPYNWKVTQPAAANGSGSAVVCTITNDRILEPSIQLVKTNDVDGAAALGDVVTYSFVITNNGETHLTGLELVDDVVDGTTFNPSPSALAQTVLAPGASLTVHATYTVTEQDVLAGSVTNVADVTGTPSNATGVPTGQDPVDDEDTSTFDTDPPNGAIRIVKTGVTPDGNEVGDVVTYTLTSTNTGNVTLTDVVINDPMLGGEITPTDASAWDSGVVGTLAPGESVTTTRTYTLTQADVDAGAVTNLADTEGTPPTGPPVEDEDPESVPTVEPEQAIDLVKTGETLDGAGVGDLVTYTLTSTNIGNVTLTDVVINDPMLGGDITPTDASAWDSGIVGTLAPGESVTTVLTYELTQDDVDAGSVYNLADTEGTPPTGPPVEDEDPETVLTEDPNADITIVKTGAALDGNGVGDVVTYTLTSTNTGNVTLTDVVIVDPMLGGDITPGDPSAWDSGVVGTLAPGESAATTATYVLTQTDVNAGSVVNLAETEGTPPPTFDPADPDTPIPPDPVQDEDPENVPTELPAARITLIKSGEALDGNGVGDIVTYTLTATNTGNQTLTDVTITDPMLGGDITPGDPAAWDSGEVGKLAPGQSVMATATYTLTQADIDAGSVTNLAETEGTPPTGPPVEDEDPETVPTDDPDPSIQIVKTGETLDGNEVGDVVTYTLVSTNTGNVTLTDVVIVDPMLGGDITPGDASAWDSGEVGTLAPGESVTATATYTITQADVDAGSVVNLAETEGTPPPTFDPDDPNTPIPSDPVEDEDPETVPTVEPEQAIELIKTGETLNGNGVGDLVTYTLTSTNIGKVTLTDVVINDPMLGGDITPTDASAWDSGIVGTLAPGESVTVVLTYELTQDDVDAGSVYNLADTEGTPPTGPPVEDEDPETVPTEDPNADIEIVKTGATLDGNEVGDEVTYTLTSTNIGNVTLTDVVINDPMLGGDITPADAASWDSGTVGTLAPGESVTTTATYVLTQADVNAGSVDNIATTKGTPPTGNPVDDEDPETVPTVTPQAEIELVKTGEALDGNGVGDVVTYTLVSTNTGKVTLTDVVIVDPMLGGDITPGEASAWSSGIVGTLQPGDTVTATGTYVLTQEDVDAGSVYNLANTEGTPPPTFNPDDPTTPIPTDPVEDEDPETVPTEEPDPAIELVKVGEALDGNGVGDVVTYTLMSTNTGNVTLTDVVINDPMLGGDITPSDPAAWDSGIVGTLAPGESVLTSAVYTLTQADVDAGSVANLADTEGTPPTGPPVDDEDPELVPTIEPEGAIELVKTGDATEGNAVGDVVTYTLTATNTGVVTLTDVTITDPMLGGDVTPSDAAAWDSGEVGRLAPGESVTATATYTLTQADIDAGSVTNLAETEGTPPTGPPVEDEDPETVPTEDPVAEIELVKTGETPDGNGVGDLVTYTLTSTNTGVVTLTNVTITDPMLGGDITPPDAAAWDSGEVGKLAPGESVTATATYTLTQADIDAGSVTNLAETEGTPPPTFDPEDPTTPIPSDPVEDEDPETVPTSDPDAAIQIVKTGETLDGNEVGDTVTYTLVSTNTGNVTLTDVVIVDPMLGGDITPTDAAAWDSGVVGTLAPGESVTTVVEYTITQEDVNAGSIVNLAETEGTPPPTFDPEDPTTPIPSDPVEDEDPETVPTVDPDGSIEITKVGETHDGAAVGDVITYTLVSTNVGNTTLTDVKVVDPMLGGDVTPADAAAWDSGVPGTLEPGDSVTAVVEYTITQDDVDAGSVVNKATTEGTPPTGPPVEDEDPETTPTEDPDPSIQIVKTGETLDGNEVGDTVTYTLVSTNTGNVTLTDVTITDPMLGGDITPADASAWDSGIPGTLAPGESVTTVVEYTITQQDVNAGSIVNLAETEGTPPPTFDPEDPDTPIPSDPVEDEDPETVPTVDPDGSIEITKVGETHDGAGVGDVITYTLVSTNVGNTTLTDVTITDPMLGGDVTPTDAAAWDSGVPGTLEPGDSVTAVVEYTITQDDVDAGSVVNKATTEGTPPTGPPVEDEDPETTPTEDPDPAIQIVKTGETLDGNEVGNVVTYTLVSTNTGNVTLTDVVIVDPMLGGDITPADASAWGSGVVGTLAPGESVTTVVEYTITQEDVNAGSIVNLAETEGTPPPTFDPEDPDTPIPSDPVEDEDPETVPTVDPDGGIEINKVGETHDGAGVGDVITYTLVSTNTGNVTLTAVTITDPMLGGDVTPADAAAWDSGIPGTLEPGDSVTAVVEYTITQDDVDAGSVVNKATTEGTPPTGPPEEDEDPETTPTEDPDPSIQIVKTGETLDGNEVGDVVTYTLVSTNTGNVTLTHVVIVDPMLGGDITPDEASAWDSGVVGTLAPGESVTTVVEYTITQQDVNAGSIVNLAETEGTPPPTFDPDDPDTPIPSDPVEDEDPETVPTVDPDGGIELVKIGETHDGAGVGDLITYTLVSTNVGNVTLTDVTITDPMLGGDVTPSDAAAWDSGIPGTLEPGDSVTVVVDYTITQDDVDAGSVVNKATTEGTPPTGPPEEDEDPETTPTEDPDPSIQIVKTGETLDGNEVGDTVTYTLVSTNTGNVTLTDVVIVDPMLGGDITPADASAWDSGIPGTLAPGESVTTVVEYTITQQDVNAGSIVNLGTTEGTPPPTFDPEDPDTPIPSDPVEDEDPETVPTVDPDGGIELVKIGETHDGTGVGDLITYTLVSTNTGNVTLTDVAIVDPMLGGDVTPADAAAWDSGIPGTLEPGDSVTVVVDYTITQDDVDAGSVANVGTTEGTPPTGPPEEDEDPETTPTEDPDPEIEIVKTGETLDGNEVGDTVTYTLVSTNTGNVTLTDVTITDPMLGGDITPTDPAAWDSGVVGTLAPGESVTATATYVLTQADVDAGSVVNLGTTEGTPPPTFDPEDPDTPIPSDPVEDEDPETVPTVDPDGGIELVKIGETHDGAGVGDLITYTLVSTNVGNVTLTDVTITDSMLGGDVTPSDASAWDSGIVGTLAPGESVTAVVDYTITQDDVDAGSVANVGTTEGTPPTGPPEEDEDPETTPTEDPDPSIRLVKFGETPRGAGVGDVVDYSLIATNTGNVTLTNVTITDPMLGGDITPADAPAWDSGIPGTLAPGESVRATATYVLTEADIDAGTVTNTATAEGTPPGDDPDPVEDDDGTTVHTDAAPPQPTPPTPPSPPSFVGPLPRTGAPAYILYTGVAGTLMVLAGAAVMAARRRKEELAES